MSAGQVALLWINKVSGIPSGGSRGPRDSSPHSIFFHFMQVLAKIIPYNRLTPLPVGLAPLPWEILDPPPILYFLSSFKSLCSQCSQFTNLDCLFCFSDAKNYEISMSE